MNQSAIEANTGCQRQARENKSEEGTIGFQITSADCMVEKVARVSNNQSAYSKTKSKQAQITFESIENHSMDKN